MPAPLFVPRDSVLYQSPLCAQDANVLVLDLGGVVFNWTAPVTGKINPKSLKRVMSTLAWNQFECGQLSEYECIEQAGRVLDLEPADIMDTLHCAKLTLECSDTFIAALKELKKGSAGKLKVYAMSNISKPHYDIVRAQKWDWKLFDGVFTSAEAGMRKPDLNFYEHVLRAIGQEHTPQNVIFVDDKNENVYSALSLGIQAFKFEDATKTIQKVRNILGDPVERGLHFLQQNKKTMYSTTNSGHVFKENFAQLLMLEATGDRSVPGPSVR
jgi:FMN phosphatase YigB (HAD superfamily)